MFSLIKQVFIVLFIKFEWNLAHVTKVSWTKCIFLNDETCMVRPTLIDLNPLGLKYYQFLTSLDKCNGGCNVLSPKISFPKEKKT